MQKKIEALLKKGILLSPELLDVAPEEIEKILQETADNPFILKKEKEKIDKKTNKKEDNKEEIQKKGKQIDEVTIIESYDEKNVKITIKDFVDLYNKRFIAIQSLLRQRQELDLVTSIRRVFSAQDKETVCFIGMVVNISITKNNNTILTLEDQTGTIKAIVGKNKELQINVKEITPDEIIGVIGTKSEKIVFVNSILFPDVPLTKEFKKTPNQEAALFIGDIHIGSKAFLQKTFERFIEWLNGNIGEENQKEIIKKIKYLFIVGDIVEGIGIYPDQEKDLTIKDIYAQYSLFTEYINKIPKHINIIISPGNHDSLRIAEPQPPLPKEFVPELYDKSNVFFVSNPSLVKIGETEKFSGFDTLIYHGFSFPFFADTIEPIRQKGGLENTENIQTFLLKKRHLAPTHGSTQYQLGYDTDPLVIKTVPDFFVTGHVHRASAKNYRNTSLLNCGCWISQTDYQEKRGLVPQPGRAIYVDLHTRETKILNFMDN